MHILLTNDDGPPNPESSPNVLSFVRALRAPPHNHTVSVVLPSTQRSWIGKAHLLPASKLPLLHQQDPSTRPANEQVTDHVTPTYYNPATGTAHATPPTDPNEDYWVLVPGTPATCVQLGLFHHSHLFPTSSAATPQSTQRSADSPIDFVISGPNHGRNTTAAFALSSGTLGGALEAAVVGVRAIAVSFAFFERADIPLLVDEACDHSANIVSRLMTDWDTNREQAEKEGLAVPDVYTVNVPLVAGLTQKPMRWTWMLDNKWTGGSLYQPLPHEETALEKAEAAGKQPEDGSKQRLPPTFQWKPSFADMLQTLRESPADNDGRVVHDRCTSITPLRANFASVWGAGGFKGDFRL